MARPDKAEKSREIRLRNAAKRQGLALMRSRRRDPHALGYGGYMLVDPFRSNAIVAGGRPHPYSMTLDDVEQFLTSRDDDSGGTG